MLGKQSQDKDRTTPTQAGGLLEGDRKELLAAATGYHNIQLECIPSLNGIIVHLPGVPLHFKPLILHVQASWAQSLCSLQAMHVARQEQSRGVFSHLLGEVRIRGSVCFIIRSLTEELTPGS